MSEPLLERIARAWRVERDKWHLVYVRLSVWQAVYPSSSYAYEGTQAECQAMIDEACARAALDTVLAAMREPSDGMLGAGYGWTGIDGKARDIWDAMLTAFEEENGLRPEK